jgi:hypothetical protein
MHSFAVVQHCLKRISHFAAPRISNYSSWSSFAQLLESRLEVSEFVFRHKAGLLYGRSIRRKPYLFAEEYTVTETQSRGPGWVRTLDFVLEPLEALSTEIRWHTWQGYTLSPIVIFFRNAFVTNKLIRISPAKAHTKCSHCHCHTWILSTHECCQIVNL